MIPSSVSLKFKNYNSPENFINRSEYNSFLRNALSWRGSVTPKVLKKVLIVIFYSMLVEFLYLAYPQIALSVGPFEYSGAVLAIILVFRINAGYDRWWEARKIWGSIVNQSRNLALSSYNYINMDKAWKKELLALISVLPYVIKNSLRGERNCSKFEHLIDPESCSKINSAQHMPTYVAKKICTLLAEAKNKNCLDGFAFLEIEKQRSILIDNAGACERILKTPIPLVMAIKARRFILFFILFLPFALVKDLGYMAPFVTGLVAYALFSLDQIGIELQNPFAKENLSHLPLDEICKTIELNVLSIEET